MGAYHAVNIAFRYPERFGKVIALSGRYDLTAQIGSFRGLFDGHYDRSIYFNTPSHFIPLLTDEEELQCLRRLEIILAVGRDDQFRRNNEELSRALWEKDVWHALHVWDGEAHRPRSWRRMVSLYL